MTLVSGNINYFQIFDSVPQISIVKPEWGGWNGRICSHRCYLRQFRKYCRHFVVHYDNPFWISADTNKDELEWPWMPNGFILKCA